VFDCVHGVSDLIIGSDTFDHSLSFCGYVSVLTLTTLVILFHFKFTA